MRLDPGTVLVGMMIQSWLSIEGASTPSTHDTTNAIAPETHVLPIHSSSVVAPSTTTTRKESRQAAHPAAAPPPPLPSLTTAPPLGFLTFIGLAMDYDISIADDKSVVISDL